MLTHFKKEKKKHKSMLNIYFPGESDSGCEHDLDVLRCRSQNERLRPLKTSLETDFVGNYVSVICGPAVTVSI